MYNRIRLLSPGMKSKSINEKIFSNFLFVQSAATQQELLQYLEQGCLNERNELLRQVGSLNVNEQNSLKPILVRLINEQIDVMKKQQDLQHGNSSNVPHRYSQDTRSPLESWFGADIYKNAYPRMPSGRVVSANDLEQIRSTQRR